MRTSSAYASILGPLLTAVLLFTTSAGLVGSSQSYTPHAPIDIVGNQGFTTENGVVRGDGSATNPYVISGWDIRHCVLTCIYVYNTSAHFVLRDIYVETDSTSSRDAILLWWVATVRIENVVVTANSGDGITLQSVAEAVLMGNRVSTGRSHGIYLYSSTHVSAMGNILTGGGFFISIGGLANYNSNDIAPDNLVNGKPVLFLKDTPHPMVSGSAFGQVILVNCTDVTVKGLSFSNVDTGIEVAYSRGGVISENSIENAINGIYVDASSGLRLEGNHVSRDSYGILVDRSSDLAIFGNRATTNGDGITIGYSSNLTISNNILASNSAAGLHFYDVGAAKVYHNDFIDNKLQGMDARGKNNMWDDGYPSGGNYWSDYRGRDACHGPAQDNCTGPDGIGDTPYRLDYGPSEGLDRYPLVRPYRSSDAPPLLQSGILWLLVSVAAGVGVVGYLLWRSFRPHVREQ